MLIGVVVVVVLVAVVMLLLQQCRPFITQMITGIVRGRDGVVDGVFTDTAADQLIAPDRRRRLRRRLRLCRRLLWFDRGGWLDDRARWDTGTLLWCFAGVGRWTG
uniref:Putative secreted peptide n=1 Tax=Anopheles braziliensis TaxID=58242 RepID=A0A2M3ZMV8_9DIPT